MLISRGLGTWAGVSDDNAYEYCKARWPGRPNDWSACATDIVLGLSPLDRMAGGGTATFPTSNPMSQSSIIPTVPTMPGSIIPTISTGFPGQQTYPGMPATPWWQTPIGVVALLGIAFLGYTVLKK